MSYRDIKKRRAYLRDYQRNWLYKRRQEFLETHPCKICGSTYNLHIIWKSGNRRRVSGNYFAYSVKKQKEIFKKVIVLCDEHQAKFHGWGADIEHGTWHKIKRYRCKCKICMTFKRRKDKEYREKTKTKRKAYYHAYYAKQKRMQAMAGLDEAERIALLKAAARKMGLI